MQFLGAKCFYIGVSIHYKREYKNKKEDYYGR